MIKVMMGSDRRKKGPLKKSGFPLKRGQLEVLDLKCFIKGMAMASFTKLKKRSIAKPIC